MVIRKSSIHGKGAFATENIERGKILECDVLEIDRSNLVNDYIFPFIGSRVCIHIGWASFLNSSKSPNLKHLRIDTSEKISYFKAIADINIGDELTLSYIK
jgi:hypothetical protein